MRYGAGVLKQPGQTVPSAPQHSLDYQDLAEHSLRDIACQHGRGGPSTRVACSLHRAFSMPTMLSHYSQIPAECTLQLCAACEFLIVVHDMADMLYATSPTKCYLTYRTATKPSIEFPFELVLQISWRFERMLGEFPTGSSI